VEVESINQEVCLQFHNLRDELCDFFEALGVRLSRGEKSSDASSPVEKLKGRSSALKKHLTEPTALDKVALRLNQRPRKTLGFETPASRLRASVATTH
jgi:hypothetical protein